MRKVSLLFSILLVASALIYSGCKKDEDEAPVPPSQTFKTTAGYVSANTSAAYGDTLRFGVDLAYNGKDALVRFQVAMNDSVLYDTTLNNQTFAFEGYSLKTILDKEVWKFMTTDIAGNVKTDSIIVTGAFGEINTYNSITLGAQNSATPGFLSYSNNAATPYTMDEAFNHQADIDMFCFYENSGSHQNMMTLAAPGSNITGIFTGTSSPENYTTKNLTWFVKTSLTAAQFDAVTNDAVLLYAFNPANKFKKAKVLAVGDVYAFMLQSGKYGLFKVTTVTGVEDGSVQFAVKIQK